jgi:hypothetical protein
MRALTVKQPWASLIASGIKQVENRTYPVPKTVRGERVAIHAGKGFDRNWRDTYPCECGNHVSVLPDFADFKPLCKACEYASTRLGRTAQTFDRSVMFAGRILCTARIVGQVHVGGVDPFINICPYCAGTGSLPFEDMASWDYDETYCADCCGTGQTEAMFFDRSFYENSPGVYGWILADIELVDDPRIHRGMLGFWEVKP